MFTKTRRDEKAERLYELDAFRGCTQAELSEVARSTTEVEFRAGHVLCRQGDAGLQAFVIAEGEAEVSVDGRVVAVLGPGDVVGEMALLERRTRAATVTALTPMRVMVLSVHEFHHVFGDLPNATRRLIESLARRLRAADERPARP